MKIPDKEQIKEAAIQAKETVEMVLFGIVMFFHVPYTNYKNRKERE